jgi:hypothetical protein
MDPTHKTGDAPEMVEPDSSREAGSDVPLPFTTAV